MYNIWACIAALEAVFSSYFYQNIAEATARFGTALSKNLNPKKDNQMEKGLAYRDT